MSHNISYAKQYNEVLKHTGPTIPPNRETLPRQIHKSHYTQYSTQVLLYISPIIGLIPNIFL